MVAYLGSGSHIILIGYDGAVLPKQKRKEREQTTIAEHWNRSRKNQKLIVD